MTFSHLYDASWLCSLPAIPLGPSHLHESPSSSQPIFLNFLPAFFCLLMTWWITLGLPIREWINNCLQELGQLTSNYTTKENNFSLPQYPLTVYKSSGRGVSWALPFHDWMLAGPILRSKHMVHFYPSTFHITLPLLWLLHSFFLLVLVSFCFVLFCQLNTNKGHLEKTTSIEKIFSSDHLVGQSVEHFLD